MITGKAHITDRYRDGRLKVTIVWPDGEWKTEIFASRAHLLRFAKEHDLEVKDARTKRSTRG